MAVRDKLQTPSNAGMVVSLSIDEATDYCSLPLFCYKPFDARDALQVIIGCVQTTTLAAQATLGLCLNSTID